MRGTLRFLLLLFGFWTIWFWMCRLMFLGYHWGETGSLSARDLFLINLLGLRMDLSMAGYLVLIPGLLLTLTGWKKNPWTARVIHGFNGAMVVVTAVVTTVDLELYRHWGYRMDATPLLYFRPEGFGSVRVVALLALLSIVLLVTAAGWTAYRRWIRPSFPEEALRPVHLMAPLLFSLLMFIPIRSGFGIAPLNTGFVYYHTSRAFPNHAGINVSWNFFRSLMYSDSATYQEKLTDPSTASEELKTLVTQGPPEKVIIRNARPNILLIVLEGFAAKLLTPLGASGGWTPRLDAASAKGILFDGLYASGDRTDKGIVSVLSGYPAQPRSSIIKYPNKTRSLPYWPRVMADQGYSTSFLYGGDPRFANMESYLVNAGFGQITRDDDFPEDIPRSKWGVHDEHLFIRLLYELDTSRGPFFKTVLTLSSHEPFDVPFGHRHPGDSDERLYLNSVRYTDSVLGHFLDAARKKVWWKDTWIIITSDHGHKYPGNPEVMDPERFRIPMLWTGGAVPDTAQVVRRIGSQVDIVSTALMQMGISPDRFPFSKNLLSGRSNEFAVYAYNNGYGFVAQDRKLVYDLAFQRYLTRHQTSEGDEKTAAVFMQALFKDYNGR